jgi:DUF4097 and DUF4098 domain-containing protein YvlB
MAGDNEKPKRSDEEISGAPDEEVYSAPEDKKSKRRGSRSNLWPLYFAGGCMGLCCLCCFLPICLLAATGASMAALLSNSETTRVATQTLTVDPTDTVTLNVDGTSGSITIRGSGSNDAVIINSTKRAYGLTKSAAEKELDNITLDVQQPDNGNEITISVNTDHRQNGFWFLANQVDLIITVPESVDLLLQNNTGSIDISGVQARSFDIQSNTGSVTFNGTIVSNPTRSFSIQTNTGSITLNLPADTSTNVDARADVGNVTVDSGFDKITEVNENHAGVGATWSGKLNDHTEDMPSLRLHTNTGSVTVNAR